jgi:hypothetical protein
MTMTKSDPEREERRRQQKEIADSLKESGALGDIFARIDAGESLTGHAGLHIGNAVGLGNSSGASAMCPALMRSQTNDSTWRVVGHLAVLHGKLGGVRCRGEPRLHSPTAMHSTVSGPGH